MAFLKTAKNSKGAEIEYGPELEAIVRKHYGLAEGVEVPGDYIFSYFAQAYGDAIDKGTYIDETEDKD